MSGWAAIALALALDVPAPAATAPTPSRAAPALAAPSGAEAAPDPAPSAAAGQEPTTGAISHRRMELSPARLDDASDLQLPPLVVTPAPSRKDRALVWIGGLLVLAAAFLWVRSRRAQLEREDQAASTAAPSDPADRPSKEDR